MAGNIERMGNTRSIFDVVSPIKLRLHNRIKQETSGLLGYREQSSFNHKPPKEPINVHHLLRFVTSILHLTAPCGQEIYQKIST